MSVEVLSGPPLSLKTESLKPEAELVGLVKHFPQNTLVPDNWLPCTGQWVAKSMYPELYEKIGDMFSVIHSSFYFMLPTYGSSFYVRALPDPDGQLLLVW